MLQMARLQQVGVAAVGAVDSCMVSGVKHRAARGGVAVGKLVAACCCWWRWVPQMVLVLVLVIITLMMDVRLSTALSTASPSWARAGFTSRGAAARDASMARPAAEHSTAQVVEEVGCTGRAKGPATTTDQLLMAKEDRGSFMALRLPLLCQFRTRCYDQDSWCCNPLVSSLALLEQLNCMATTLLVDQRAAAVHESIMNCLFQHLPFSTCSGGLIALGQASAHAHAAAPAVSTGAKLGSHVALGQHCGKVMERGCNRDAAVPAQDDR